MPRLVVVIDDDFDIRESLRDLLELEGYEVLTASDGEEALALLRRAADRPLVAVVDLLMPRMDGRQLLTEMRADPRLAEVPVVVCSTQSDMALPAPVHIVRKPFDLSALLGAIHEVAGEPA